MSKINDLKPLNLEEAILCLNAITLKKINFKALTRWISQCGEVEDKNNFDKDLLTLVLKSFVFKDKKNVVEFEEEFSKFLDYKETKFRRVQPFYIITLCENLFAFKKQQFLNMNKFINAYDEMGNFLFDKFVIPLSKGSKNILIDNNEIIKSFLTFKTAFMENLLQTLVWAGKIPKR